MSLSSSSDLELASESASDLESAPSQDQFASRLATGAPHLTSFKKILRLQRPHCAFLISSLPPDAETQRHRLGAFEALVKRLSGIPARKVLGGSFAKGTDLRGDKSDVDIVVITKEITKETRPVLLSQIEAALQADASIELETQWPGVFASSSGEYFLDDWAYLGYTGLEDSSRPHAYRSCGHYIAGRIRSAGSLCRFDLLVAGELPKNYHEMLLRASPLERRHMAPALVEVQVNFVKQQSTHCRSAIRLLKWWSKEGLNQEIRPKSYIWELLMIYVAQNNPDVEIPQSLLMKCLRALIGWRSLRIVWSWQGFIERDLLLDGGLYECPVILDPANPLNNVAQSVHSWNDLCAAAGATLALLTKNSLASMIHIWEPLYPLEKEAEASPALGLRNLVDFPPYAALPPEYNEPPDRWYKETRHGWVGFRGFIFLGEIVDTMSFIRPWLLLRSVAGERVPVALYPEDWKSGPVTFSWDQLRVGSTVAILDPHQHTFLNVGPWNASVMDGGEHAGSGMEREGLRLDEPGGAWFVKVFPHSLSNLFDASDSLLQSNLVCTQCGLATVPYRCGNCKVVKYCSQQCQRKHWKAFHQRACKGVPIVQRLIALLRRPKNERGFLDDFRAF